jgi:hypothetical protein
MPIDYLFGAIRSSQTLGLVWRDTDNDGQVDFGEAAILGAVIELTGVEDRGSPVSRSVATDANGIYGCNDPRPSDAAGDPLREFQPAGFVDGVDSLGPVNGGAVGIGATTPSPPHARLECLEKPNGCSQTAIIPT